MYLFIYRLVYDLIYHSVYLSSLSLYPYFCPSIVLCIIDYSTFYRFINLSHNLSLYPSDHGIPSVYFLIDPYVHLSLHISATRHPAFKDVKQGIQTLSSKKQTTKIKRNFLFFKCTDHSLRKRFQESYFSVSPCCKSHPPIDI